MYALVDCNNFYASCERVFQPKLRGRPIVVLSFNDGCVIARSQEAKDIGIPMGAPAFKHKHLFERFNVAVFSANFVLYGDISSRVMKILRSSVPDIEIYSIDEAFLKFKLNESRDLRKTCLEIHDEVERSTGIPISVGIAPTKTLAKIGSHVAKKDKSYKGVFDWNLLQNKDELLRKTPVGDIWGVGFRTTYKMNAVGIYNALQLRDANEAFIRKQFSVSILRTQTELREIACLTLESVQPRKGIMSSRSFGRPVFSKEELRQAVATYISRGCEKLREQKSAASYIYVSIKTSMHKSKYPQYFAYKIKSLPYASFYTPDFISRGFEILDEIYKPGYRYKKATIMLLGITPQNQMQLSFGEKDNDFHKKVNLTKTFDGINNRYGLEVIKYGATGTEQPWRVKNQLCSPRYTTSWEDLLVVR